MCLRRRTREPSCISLHPFANDVSRQFIWAISKTKTRPCSPNQWLQTVAMTSTHPLISIGRVGQGRIVRKWLRWLRQAFVLFCIFECKFPPKSGQLQQALSWLTIIMMGCLMAQTDGPTPKLSNKASQSQVGHIQAKLFYIFYQVLTNLQKTQCS